MLISRLMIGLTFQISTMFWSSTLVTGDSLIFSYSHLSSGWGRFLFRCCYVVSFCCFILYLDVIISRLVLRWGPDKFPKETPLVFFRDGQPIHPYLELMDGLKVVVKNMVAHIEKAFPKKVLKFWRLQSPRHFYGGDWNQNGSCLFDEPLKESELDLWFDPANNGTNREARRVNEVIGDMLKGTSIRPLDLSGLSEWRADAHPAVWLGKKDAVAVWGQDCMHWCLPGVPDTWLDILAQLITYNLASI